MRVKRAPLCLRPWFGKLSRLTWGTTGMGCYRLLPASCLEDLLVDFDPDVMRSARRGFPCLEARALVENLSVEVRTQKFTSSFPSELDFVFPRDFYGMWETQCISVPFPTPCSAGLSSFGGMAADWRWRLNKAVGGVVQAAAGPCLLLSLWFLFSIPAGIGHLLSC